MSWATALHKKKFSSMIVELSQKVVRVREGEEMEITAKQKGVSFLAVTDELGNAGTRDKEANPR